MTGWEKFKNFIKSPGKWLFAFYGGLAASIAAAVLVAVYWNMENPVAYFLYAVMAALLVYCIIITVKYARAFFKRQIRSHKITSRLADDYGYRTLMFSAVSFAVNAGYAVLQGVLGIVYRSAWYGTFAVYYLVLSLLRGGTIALNVRIDRRPAKEGERLRSKLLLYMGCGGMLIVLSLALSAVLAYMIINDVSFQYAGLTIYMMAAYAFYKIIISSINLAKAKKFNDYGVQSFRNINFTDALVSIFALQTAMIATFGGEGGQGSMRPMNIAMGAAVFLLTLGLGIYMIISAAAKIKKGAAENSAGGGIARGTEE